MNDDIKILTDQLFQYHESGLISDELQSNKLIHEIFEWRPIILDDGTEIPYSVTEHGLIKNNKTNHVKKTQITRDGYIQVRFSVNNELFSLSVHRIVANAFVEGRTEENNEVDHIDGIKTHNMSTNLEWVNRSEQIKRAYRNNLIQPIHGENVAISRYSNEFIYKLCEYLADGGYTNRQIAENLGVEYTKKFKSLVDGIKLKRRWVFISDNFIFPNRQEKYFKNNKKEDE